MILAVAKKCKHCGESMNTTNGRVIHIDGPTGILVAVIIALLLAFGVPALIEKAKKKAQDDVNKELMQRARQDVQTIFEINHRSETTHAPYVVPSPSSAHAPYVVPNLVGHVVDQAGFLGNKETAQVESTILEMERATGGKMAVLTVPSLGGDTLESFSARVAESWKIGHKGQDNGALLVLVRDSHDIRLEIGYGWEGAVSAFRAGDIIRGMGPFFREGHFGDGLVYAVRQIQKNVTMNGEPRPAADR